MFNILVLLSSPQVCKMYRQKIPYSHLLTQVGDWVDQICRVEMAQVRVSVFLQSSN